VKPVDRTIVLAPNQVRELGRLCGERSFGPLAEVYVLLLGIAGGRPGDPLASAPTSSTLHRAAWAKFDSGGRPGGESIRPFLTSTTIPAATWDPLKGREIEEERRVPLPSRDTKRIRQLVRPSDLAGPLFHEWDWEKFSREAWTPAKVEMASRHAHRSETARVSRQEPKLSCRHSAG
jgi:hypothetical protein